MLWRLAEESGLDMSRLERDYGAGEAYQAVLRDYADGVAWFGVSAAKVLLRLTRKSMMWLRRP